MRFLSLPFLLRNLPFSGFKSPFSLLSLSLSLPLLKDAPLFLFFTHTHAHTPPAMKPARPLPQHPAAAAEAARVQHRQRTAEEILQVCTHAHTALHSTMHR